MICSNCLYENEGGKFCSKCGTPLQIQQEAATIDSRFQQSTSIGSQDFTKAKQFSQRYFQYYLQVLKKPYTSCANSTHNYWINGLITIAFFALLIPLIIEVGLGDVRPYFESSFTESFLKPFIGYTALTTLISVYIFAVLKLRKVSVTLQSVIGRVGTLLVPFTALFLLAVVMAFLQMKLFILLLIIGFIAAITIVPTLVLVSYSKEATSGLDTVYGALIVFIFTLFSINIMSELLLSMFIHLFEGLFNYFLPF